MAQSSYPFDGTPTNESQYSQFFRQLQDTGVAASASAADLKAVGDGSGMNVKVQPGFAIVRGHAYQSTAAETLTIAAADSQARTDLVVLRLAPAANSIVLAVVKGAAGAGVPTPEQTDTDVYELVLAQVAVGANVTTITSANVTDLRRFTGQRIGVWTADSQPTAPKVGHLGLNTSSAQWEWWDGDAWIALAPVVDWTNIDGKPVAFAPAPHSHLWSDLNDKPNTFPPSAHWHDWADFSGSAPFAAVSHTHSWSSIQSKPTTFTPSTHSHSQYLTTSDEAELARGSTRPYTNAASGSSWYAVWVEQGRYFCRNTSAAKFKKNIQDFEIDPEIVLKMRPVIYDRKDKVDDETGEFIEGRKGEVGLIADEVDELGLDWMVNYLDGEIDGLRYDLLGVALLPVVQRQEAHINELESRLARLEALLHRPSAVAGEQGPHR